MTYDPIEMLKKAIAGRSMRALAREIPCSAAYLSDVLRGMRLPGPRILKYLGLERKVNSMTEYRRASK